MRKTAEFIVAKILLSTFFSLLCYSKSSCWAFATVALVETSYARKGNPLTSFSEQMLVDCEKTSLGCSGGYPYYGRYTFVYLS